MALIPGSYARAAGLQSEINKVTVTRVAGSEVQFQRTIDTYQKDLRYNVNQIQREQRQLRRSMRRYHHKLRQGRKDREQRQLQLQAQQQRSRRLAEEGRLLLPQILTLDDDDRKADKGTVHDKGSEETQQEEQAHYNHTSTDHPDSNDSADALTESVSQSQADRDGFGEKGSNNGSKPILTRNKANAYFRSHKGLKKEKSAKRKKTSDNEERTEGNDDGDDKDENGEDSVLPSIAEEEEQNGRNTPGDEVGLSASFRACEILMEPSSSSNPTGLESIGSSTRPNTDTKLRSADNHVILPSLDTKSIQRKASFASAGNNDSSSTPDTAEHKSQLTQDASASPAMAVSRSPGKPTRRTGVSYGDLIKLQHTHSSSTKKLFSLVDRLASKHGIVDLPTTDSSSRRKRYSSMDPRSNAKIKQRGQEQAQSLMSDGMVKQAAILYFIKYGYSQRDEEEPVERAESSALVTERGSLALDENPRSPEEHLKTRSVDGGGRKVGPKREASLALVSKTESHNVATSGDVSSLLSNSGTNSEHVQNSRGRQSMSMLALSQHVTAIKSRSVDRHNLESPPLSRRISARSKSTTSAVGRGGTGHDPGPLYDSLGEPALQKLSPLPANLGRSRRDSIRSLLNERLHEVGASSSGVAWQSAFGRLKMVHTLVDLSPYFVRDSP